MSGERAVILQVTEENITTIFRHGDIIIGAEELGTVRSARMTIHNNGTAFVYFDVPHQTGDYGTDTTKDVFAVPQTITVRRAGNGREAQERTCMMCDTARTLWVHPDDMAAWKAGKQIQKAIPYLSYGDRELLKTGACGPCFDEAFPEED